MPSYGEFVPEFHPEFGYLSPTRKGKRTVRVALAAAAFGIVTGAVGAMVLVPRAGHDGRIEQAFVAIQGDPAGPAATVGHAATAPTERAELDASTAGQSLPAAASARRSAAPKAAAPAAPDTEKPCKEETWPYFDSRCLWGGPRKDAAVVAATPAEPPTAAPAQAEPAATNPPEQRQVTAKKKKPKSTNASARRRSQEPDPRSANVHPHGNPYGGPFGNSYANPQGNQYGPWRSGSYEQRRDWGWGGW